METGRFGRASGVLRDSWTAGILARVGLLARAGFYLLLAFLVVQIMLVHGGQPANASGALHTVASTPLGRIPVALAAVGFLAFGVVRLLGAVRDRAASRTSRLTTGLQGLFYLGLTWVPASFVLGSRSTGSEQQERTTTGHILMLPAGRALVTAAGLVFVGVCVWQIVTAARTGFTESLRTEHSPRWVAVLIRVTGWIGITMRALVFLPIGVFLVVAALRFDRSKAKGLDAGLSALAQQQAGRVLLGIIATGFTIFAVYSLLEARYRDVDAGD